MKIVIEVDGQVGLTVWGNVNPAAIRALIDLITILMGLAQLMEGFQRLNGM